MKPARILIIEDDRALRTVTRITLQLAGHLIAEAFNGIDALTILAAEDPPEIVLLDLQMPGMDGFEFLDRVSAMRPRRRRGSSLLPTTGPPASPAI